MSNKSLIALFILAPILVSVGVHVASYEIARLYLCNVSMTTGAYCDLNYFQWVRFVNDKDYRKGVYSKQVQSN